MATGVQHTETIDLVAESSDKKRLVLSMIEERAWDGSRDRLLQLQEKFNNYLKFILDGEMKRRYPDAHIKEVEIRLYCAEEPDGSVAGFLGKIEPILRDEQIALEVRPLPTTKLSCTQGCPEDSCPDSSD